MARAPDLPPPGPELAFGLGRAWLAHYPMWILAGLAISTWFFMRHIQLTHDIIWQFWAARQMLGGTRLYSEIWEVNPPLWFWSAMPIQWLATQFGIAWQSLLVPLLIALSALSAFLVLRLVDLGRPIYNLLLLLLVFWISAVVPLSEIGQREHFFLMFSLPYAALIARRTSGKSIPVPLAVVVSVFASLGFALKHYFLFVPIALELWLWLSTPRSWKPWRPELFVLAGLAAAYTICVAWIAPEFFTVALPMIKTSYYDFDATLFEIIFRPWAIYWAMAILYLISFQPHRAFHKQNQTTPFFLSIVILCICFLFSYFIQHKGPYYHSLPATGAFTIAIGLYLSQLQRVRIIPISLGIALMYLPLSTTIAIQDKSQKFVDLADQLFSGVPVGEPVFVASANPLFWSAVERHKLVWPSRTASLWMLPAIAKSELIGPSTPELKEMALQLNSTIYEDLRCNPPAIILFPNSIPVGNGKYQFSIGDFLFRDPNLRQFIESNYLLTEKPDGVHSYLRKSAVHSAADIDCRTIR